MSRSSHSVLGFDQAHLETNVPGWSARTNAPSPWPVLTALRAMWHAVREGLAAHRRYEHLRSRGTPHDTAIRQALYIGVTPSQITREAAKSLYFAGKA